jgi:hypothetical protein
LQEKKTKERLSQRTGSREDADLAKMIDRVLALGSPAVGILMHAYNTDNNSHYNAERNRYQQ